MKLSRHKIKGGIMIQIICSHCDTYITGIPSDMGRHMTGEDVKKYLKSFDTVFCKKCGKRLYNEAE